MKYVLRFTLTAMFCFVSAVSALAYDINVKVYLDEDCDGIRDDGEPLADSLDPVTITVRYCDQGDCTDQIAIQRSPSPSPGDPVEDFPVTDACLIDLRMAPPFPDDGPPFGVCVEVTSVPAGFVLGGFEWFAASANASPCDVTAAAADAAMGSLFDGDMTTSCFDIPFVLPGPTLRIGLCEEEREGGEGCTPGFWKNARVWPIPRETPFDAIFDDAFPGLNMFQVVWLRGGGLNRLGAHAVAAYLNALTIEYDLTPGEVVAAFNAAFASGDSDVIESTKDDFDALNNQGCPLDNGRQRKGAGGAELAVGEVFRRGDANASGDVDVSDGVLILNWLFAVVDDTPSCPDAADANDDGRINISDSVRLLTFLFQGGPPPAFPGPANCAADPTKDLLDSCVYSAPCPLSSD